MKYILQVNTPILLKIFQISNKIPNLRELVSADHTVKPALFDHIAFLAGRAAAENHLRGESARVRNGNPVQGCGDLSPGLWLRAIACGEV
jgi:hypothetical protein